MGFRPILLALLLGLSSCLVGPNYQEPCLDCPDGWYGLSDQGIDFDTSGVLVDWWALFEDSALNELLRRAACSNFSVKEAAARIWEAREKRRLIASNTAPSFVPGLTISRTRDSANVAFTNFGDAFDQQLAFNEAELGLDISWEIDLWGRNKRRIESADAQYWASVFDRRALILSLMGEVASTYADIRGLQKRLELASQNIEIQKDVVQLTQCRTDAGLGSGLETEQAMALLKRSEAEVPILQAKLDWAINRMGVLVAECPSVLWDVLHVPGRIPVKPPLIPVGLSTDLVRRRPDLQRAERELASATAEIGVAVADYFPRVLLTQALGLAAPDVTNLFEGRSLAWEIGAALLGPIIRGNRLKANVCLQRAKAQQAFFHYEQVVLEAFEEVRNAIIAYQTQQERLASLKLALEHSVASFQISTELYTHGLTDFLDLLAAQRAMLVISDQMAASEAQVIVDAVRLFKALGGGWELAECL